MLKRRNAKVNFLQFQCIQLRKKTLDAFADVIALGAQQADFLFQLFDDGHLLMQLRFSAGGTLFRGGAGVALTADHFDGTQNALFERRKIIHAQGQRGRFFLLLQVLVMQLNLRFNFRLNFWLDCRFPILIQCCIPCKLCHSLTSTLSALPVPV